MSDHFATDPLPPAPETLHLADLEAELTTLTGHINAAICRFLVVLEEFDRLRGYERHGLVSAAHWLNWRCGFGLNAAREKVRVARALPSLPQIRARFETGELSYSKVRAMTRVATPDNEDVLLQVALHGTAHHVETLVGKWRGAERARDMQRADKRHAGRSLSWHYDDEGCLVIRATLPPEQGAVVIEALRAAIERIAEEDGESVDVAAETHDGGGGDVTAETRCGGGGEDVTAETHGADDTAEHACNHALAGVAVRDVTAETPGERCGDFGSVPDVTAETSDAAPSGRPTLCQRRADALVFLAETSLADITSPASGGDRYLVTVHIDEHALAGGATGRSELEEGPGLAAETVRRLCCDGGVVTAVDDEDGRPLDVGRKTRAIPPAIRRALSYRDRCCRFPGCTRTRWLDGHHVVHWADGGETSLGNLVRLCHHHHRLIHEGGFGAHLDARREIRFTTPAGAVIPETPPGPRLDRPLQLALETFHIWSAPHLPGQMSGEGRIGCVHIFGLLLRRARLGP